MTADYNPTEAQRLAWDAARHADAIGASAREWDATARELLHALADQLEAAGREADRLRTQTYANWTLLQQLDGLQVRLTDAKQLDRARELLKNGPPTAEPATISFSNSKGVTSGLRAVSTALVDEHAAKQYHAYLRGWVAGASGWYADTAMQEHPDAIRDAYDLGYNDGHLLRGASVRFASTTYGFYPRS